MSIYSLYIASIPPISVTSTDILSVSGYRRALGGESSTVTVTVDNARGHLTELFLTPQLRAAATVDTPRGEVSGRVQSVSMGATITLTLEL